MVTETRDGRCKVHVRWFIPGVGPHVEIYDIGIPSDVEAWALNEALKYPNQVERIESVEA